MPTHLSPQFSGTKRLDVVKGKRGLRGAHTRTSLRVCQPGCVILEAVHCPYFAFILSWMYHDFQSTSLLTCLLGGKFPCKIVSQNIFLPRCLGGCATTPEMAIGGPLLFDSLMSICRPHSQSICC